MSDPKTFEEAVDALVNTALRAGEWGSETDGLREVEDTRAALLAAHRREAERLTAERDAFFDNGIKVAKERDAARAEVERLDAEKNGAYSERNKLVAALSTLFPASLERHPEDDEEWEDDWRWVVYIDLPTGQVSWHLHDSHLALFDHLPRFQGRAWDGHTTEEKYERLAALAQGAQAPPLEEECATCHGERRVPYLAEVPALTDENADAPLPVSSIPCRACRPEGEGGTP